MSGHVNEFEKDYRNATRLSTGGAVEGAASVIAGGILCIFTAGVSAGIVGLTLTALTAAVIAAIGEFQKTYKEKDFRKTIETELDGFQKKISPIIEMIENILIHTEKILRDPTLSENKANAIYERFSYLFEKMQLLQGHGNREVGDRMSKTLHFSGNLSKTLSQISSVLDVLEEILEGEVQESNDRPAETPRPKQIDGKLFKIKAEKFIVDMKELIS